MYKGTMNELLGKPLHTNISATGVIDPGTTHLRIQPTIQVHEPVTNITQGAPTSRNNTAVV